MVEDCQGSGHGINGRVRGVEQGLRDGKRAACARAKAHQRADHVDEFEPGLGGKPGRDLSRFEGRTRPSNDSLELPREAQPSFLKAATSKLCPSLQVAGGLVDVLRYNI